MSSKREQDAYNHRLETRRRLIEEGRVPYPQEGHKTHTNVEALEQEHEVRVTVAGRIRAIRGHGKIRFIDIEDESGRLQVVIKSNEVDNFTDMDDVGVGDYIRVTGTRFATRAGQESVKA